MKSKIVRDFLQALKNRLGDASAADAIALARLYGNVAWNNPVNILHADEIENILYEKIAPVRDRVIASANETKNGRLLHVLTEGYTSGGHTRVLERLIGARGDFSAQDVAIIEICPIDVDAKFSAQGATVRRIQLTGLEAILALAAMMAEYSHVVLHIHPDDIVSSLCARIARATGTRIALYNHADHCFTYGGGSIDVICEISAYGQNVNRAYRPTRPTSFAGIPLNIGAPISRKEVRSDIVLSSGPAYKFDLADGGVFSAIAERVIEELGLRMRLIGPAALPLNASEKLIEFVRSGKLMLTPPLDYQTYLQNLRECLCYVDSAPVTGGSALPEAALSGVPCVGLANAVMGYSPIDAIRSASTGTLIDRIRRIRDGNEGVLTVGRKELIAVHSPETVLRRIIASVTGDLIFPLPYSIDESTLDIQFPAKQWEQHPEVIIHTRAFDFMSVSSRLGMFFMMRKFGILERMDRTAALKVFVSNIVMRRMRNR